MKRGRFQGRRINFNRIQRIKGCRAGSHFILRSLYVLVSLNLVNSIREFKHINYGEIKNIPAGDL